MTRRASGFRQGTVCSFLPSRRRTTRTVGKERSAGLCAGCEGIFGEEGSSSAARVGLTLALGGDPGAMSWQPCRNVPSRGWRPRRAGQSFRFPLWAGWLTVAAAAGTTCTTSTGTRTAWPARGCAEPRRSAGETYPTGAPKAAPGSGSEDTRRARERAPWAHAGGRMAIYRRSRRHARGLLLAKSRD
jgi:hypothetical protein